MLRFAGFELDQRRAELRGPEGEPIRLRPKPFLMLHVLAASAGHVVSKQQLMDAVWPNIHVGEDSLFQCIREIRAALGDDERRLIKVVSGRGYLFDAEVSGEPLDPKVQTEFETVPQEESDASDDGDASPPPLKETRIPKGFSLFGLTGRVAVAAVAGLCAVAGFAVAAPIFAPDLLFKRPAPSIVVTPIIAKGDDPQTVPMAAGVTVGLTDGLAGIENIRTVTMSSHASASATLVRSDFVLQGELKKSEQSWVLQARIINSATGEVMSASSISVPAEGADDQLKQTRLAAGVGEPLALRLNAYLESREATDSAASGRSKVVVEQATASINQTTHERFMLAQKMLEDALVADPGSVDVQVTLAGLKTRGIQMVWYGDDGPDAERSARSLLEGALRAAPRYIPALEAYCRYLTATNNFAESLVACARVLSFDPWNGSALYQLGLTQIHLGRYEDALATFRKADRFDTPAVSRWTWLLGIGWANLMLERNEDAIGWLERSIAITPASGRSYLLLAVAHQRVGDEAAARAALAKIIELRPGSTAGNVSPPTRNASPVFIADVERVKRILIDLGLPQG